MARILLAKPGLDGHEAGVLLVARALRDAGHEVIYLGCRQRPSSIAAAAVDEDADVVGLSVLTGGHRVHTKRVIEALASAGAADIPVILGGIIPAGEIEELHAMGVSAVFGPGDALGKIVSRVADLSSV